MRNIHVTALMVVALTAAGIAAGGADYVASSELNDAGLIKHWQFQVPLDPGQRVTDVYLVDDQLYVCTRDGCAFAVHAYSGALRWMRQVTQGGYRLSRPVHFGRQVIFVTPGELVAYDRVYGDGLERRWVTGLGATAPAADAKSFYTGGSRKRIYSFSGKDLSSEWEVICSDRVVGQMAVHEGLLYFATIDGQVYAVKPVQRTAVWAQFPRTSGDVAAGVAVSSAGVFVPSHDRSLWLFDPTYGNEIWRTRLSAPLDETPVVFDEIAYQFNDADGVVAIKIREPDDQQRILWKVRGARHVVTETDDFVYLLTRDQTLAVVQREEGQVVREIATPGLSMTTPVVGDTALYLFGEDGRIFCAKQKGERFPRWDDVVAALSPDGSEAAEDADSAEIVAEAIEAPAAAEAEPEPVEDPLIALERASRGKPIGGKSKISKNWDPEKGAASNDE